jgi:hypothetical protein
LARAKTSAVDFSVAGAIPFSARQLVPNKRLADHPDLIQADFKRIHPPKTQVLKPKEFLDWFSLDANPVKHFLSIDLHLGEKFSGLDVMRQIPDTFDRVLTTDDHFNEKAMELSQPCKAEG